MPKRERSSPAPAPQEVEWLTPAPDGTPVVLAWPDETGPFLLTCHLARVNGRTMLVGLDVRSFHGPNSDAATAGKPSDATTGSAPAGSASKRAAPSRRTSNSTTADAGSDVATGPAYEPGPQGLIEVNHPALRSLRAGEIAEAARAKLAAMVAATAGSTSWDQSVRDAAARRSEMLTSPNKSRVAGVRPASDQLHRVADLYLQAVAAGGDSARRPSIYVHHALTEDGLDLSLNTVRGQLHRARVKGLIPPAKD